MATLLNTFAFDKNGYLIQIDDILAAQPTPVPGPTPSPVPPGPMTIRFRFSNKEFDPNTLDITKGTWTKVQYAAENDWDFVRNDNLWRNMFENKFTEDNGYVDIIENGDISTITSLDGCFKDCTALRNVKLVGTTNLNECANIFTNDINLAACEITDTGSNVNWSNAFSNCKSLTNYDKIYLDKASVCANMFNNCTSLNHLALFNLTGIVSVDLMFNGSINVSSGMYDLYLAFEQTGKDWLHYGLPFQLCGTATESGRAERAKIPVQWGGDLT